MLIHIFKYFLPLFVLIFFFLQGAIELVLVLPCNILKNILKTSDSLYYVLALIKIIYSYVYDWFSIYLSL